MDNLNLFQLIFHFSRRSILLDQFFIYITNYLNWLVLLFTLVWALWGGKKEKQILFIAVLGIVLGIFLIQLIHLFITEPRPFLTLSITPLIPPPTSFSFPSGHATIASALTTAYFLEKSRLTPYVAVAAFLVSFSRIYVGVHYPLDILGGVIVGFVSASTIRWIKNKLAS